MFDDSSTKATIKNLYDTENYLCDPHTAVAVNVYHQYVEQTGDNATPSIIASTASPYKFAASVLDALLQKNENADEFSMIDTLSAVTGTTIPEPIAQLKNKELRFNNVCDVPSMPDTVLQILHLK